MPQLATHQGGEPSARDAEGRTPLHHAVMRGHVDVVDVLLKHGGPGLLMTKDILGCTPIHLAAVQNQVWLHMCALVVVVMATTTTLLASGHAYCQAGQRACCGQERQNPAA